LISGPGGGSSQRAAARRFLDGQGWGVGGSVDVAEAEPWNVVGRYGWTGGSGTAAHVVPGTGTVAILLFTAAMPDPAATALQKAAEGFWTYAARP
jgi:CubicO group peptidase (beta-lactamase class C family)